MRAEEELRRSLGETEVRRSPTSERATPKGKLQKQIKKISADFELYVRERELKFFSSEYLKLRCFVLWRQLLARALLRKLNGARKGEVFECHTPPLFSDESSVSMSEAKELKLNLSDEFVIAAMNPLLDIATPLKQSEVVSFSVAGETSSEFVGSEVDERARLLSPGIHERSIPSTVVKNLCAVAKESAGLRARDVPQEDLDYERSSDQFYGAGRTRNTLVSEYSEEETGTSGNLFDVEFRKPKSKPRRIIRNQQLSESTYSDGDMLESKPRSSHRRITPRSKKMESKLTSSESSGAEKRRRASRRKDSDSQYSDAVPRKRAFPVPIPKPPGLWPSDYYSDYDHNPLQRSKRPVSDDSHDTEPSLSEDSSSLTRHRPSGPPTPTATKAIQSVLSDTPSSSTEVSLSDTAPPRKRRKHSKATQAFASESSDNPSSPFLKSQASQTTPQLLSSSSSSASSSADLDDGFPITDSDHPPADPPAPALPPDDDMSTDSSAAVEYLLQPRRTSHHKGPV